MSKWPKITLESPWGRLMLVTPTQEDDAEVASLRSDPGTLKYTPFSPRSMSVDQARTQREANARNDTVWNFYVHLIPESSGEPSRFVGQSGIKYMNPANRSGDIGILISPKVHRLGIATEVLFVLLSHAFEYPGLELERAEFVTGPHNIRMRGWFEKFGVREDTRPLLDYITGDPMIDAVGYRILATEWPELKEKMGKWLDARIPHTKNL